MDYEKKYKEALEEARRYMDAGSSDLTYVLPEIFPELAESDDERIRKALCEFMHDTLGDEFDDYNFSKQEALAYLEKQKEQKPVEWSEEKIDKVVTYLHERDGGMLWCKAKEIASDICDILRPQPKQEWSEEDEKLLNKTKQQLRIIQSHLSHSHGESMSDQQYSSRNLGCYKLRSVYPGWILGSNPFIRNLSKSGTRKMRTISPQFALFLIVIVENTKKIVMV